MKQVKLVLGNLKLNLPPLSLKPNRQLQLYSHPRLTKQTQCQLSQTKSLKLVSLYIAPESQSSSLRTISARKPQFSAKRTG